MFEPLDESTTREATLDVERIVNNDPRWNVLETLVTKPDDHTLNIKVRMAYIDTGTAEELFLTFTGEE